MWKQNRRGFFQALLGMFGIAVVKPELLVAAKPETGLPIETLRSYDAEYFSQRFSFFVHRDELEMNSRLTRDELEMNSR